MPRPSLSAKTGDASVMKMGHTTDGKNGSNPDFKPNADMVRDLEIKGSGGSK